MRSFLSSHNGCDPSHSHRSRARALFRFSILVVISLVSSSTPPPHLCGAGLSSTGVANSSRGAGSMRSLDQLVVLFPITGSAALHPLRRDEVVTLSWTFPVSTRPACSSKALIRRRLRPEQYCPRPSSRFVGELKGARIKVRKNGTLWSLRTAAQR